MTAVKARTPHTADDFRAALEDRGSMRRMVNNGDLPQFVAEYARAVNDADRDRVVQEQLQQQHNAALEILAKMAGREPGQVDPRRLSDASARGALFSKTAPGAAVDGVFESLGDMFRAATRDHASEYRAQLDRVRSVQNAYGSQIPADGGFLVAEEVRSMLLSAALESSIVRPRATVVPMSTSRTGVPTVDETSRNGSVFGWTGYWTEQGQTATESEARFARIELEAMKLELYSEAPNELIADAPAFGAVMNRAAPAAVSFWEDGALINGSGTGEPLGYLNGNGVIKIDPAVTGHVAYTDVTAMFCRLLPGSFGKAIWVVSPDLVADLLAMSFKGPATTEIDVSPGAVDFDSNGQMRILGRPAIISEHAPAASTDGALSLVDLTHYLVGDRQTMQLSASPHYKFGSDITAFKIIERVDGQPWLNSAITPANGSSTTMSAYVSLSGTHT
jgi:HK97 family phage major capsid protein